LPLGPGATCLGNPVDARRDHANTGRVQRRALTILLRAALWLAAALVLSGCATSTAPGAVGVTRSQLMIVPSAAVAARAAEGYARISSDASQAGRLNTDAALTARVRGVGRQLIAVAGSFRPDAAGWPWEINVIQSAELNAFCMPGGKIAVYSGLVERLQLTDAEIAAVMGHEISHALREHSREKISQQTLRAPRRFVWKQGQESLLVEPGGQVGKARQRLVHLSTGPA
jgi:Zn-dependent protease with chaperone function